jgi:hypothetical protein
MKHRPCIQLQTKVAQPVIVRGLPSVDSIPIVIKLKTIYAGGRRNQKCKQARESFPVYPDRLSLAMVTQRNKKCEKPLSPWHPRYFFFVCKLKNFISNSFSVGSLFAPTKTKLVYKPPLEVKNENTGTPHSQTPTRKKNKTNYNAGTHSVMCVCANTSYVPVQRELKITPLKKKSPQNPHARLQISA